MDLAAAEPGAVVRVACLSVEACGTGKRIDSVHFAEHIAAQCSSEGVSGPRSGMIPPPFLPQMINLLSAR